MKPIDIFKTWLDAAKIEYTEQVFEDGCITLEVSSKASYIGFVSVIEFNSAGNLINIASYE